MKYNRLFSTTKNLFYKEISNKFIFGYGTLIPNTEYNRQILQKNMKSFCENIVGKEYFYIQNSRDDGYNFDLILSKYAKVDDSSTIGKNNHHTFSVNKLLNKDEALSGITDGDINEYINYLKDLGIYDEYAEKYLGYHKQNL